MTKRKGIVVLAFPFALVLATFVAREMREHPQAKQKRGKALDRADSSLRNRVLLIDECLICCADFAIKVRFDKTTRLVTEVECGG